MTAPPVISLVDGSVWERRAVTAAGVALYALAGSCKCPEYVMATEAELAEFGIAGSAHALPMPVGANLPDVEGLLADAVRLAGESVAELKREHEISGELRQYLDEVHESLTGANLSLYEEELENARLRLALKSAQRGRRQLRARIAELQQERHETNESLSKAMERLAELEAARSTVYRVVDGVTTVALYSSPDQAQKHCEFLARIEHEGDGTQELYWREDEDSVALPEQGEAWLIELVKPGFSRLTGFAIAPAPLSAVFSETGGAS